MSTKKNFDIFRYRFSTGSASYFFDAIDEMFKETFKADIEADYAFFTGLSITDPTNDDPKGVDWTGLNLGFA